jgi:hypothetical protein
MMGMHDLPRSIRLFTDDHLVSSNPLKSRPVTMKTVLAVVLIVLILSNQPGMAAGGFEVEVGDVQGNEIRPNLNKGKQDETEKAQLKAVDEKLRKAEEEGNRPAAQDSGTESSAQTPANTEGTKP